MNCPATQTAHQIKIEYDTAEAAFSDPLVGEKDAAFFTPKFRKEATPCISHPAATAPLKALCKASPASTTTTAATPERRRIAATAFSILAYAVELTGKVGGKIQGNLYELDYPQHFRHVAAEAVQSDTIILHYEKGDREQPASLYFDGRPDPKLGAFLRYEAKPNEPENLREVLRQEQKGREQLQPGDFKAHVTALHDRLIRDEAQRIVAGMKELSTPNSPNKTHFMVELSPYFTQIASSKDTDRLFSMLPYKSLVFTGIKDRHGIYAMIGKDENRDKEVRRPRASIRKQLSENKQAQTPKKAPARTKKNELEV